MSRDAEIRRLAERLWQAYRDGTATDAAPLRELSVPEAYRVQRALAERRAGAEGSPVGYKLGFTNEAVRAEVGVEEPAFGRLFERAVDPEAVRVDRLVTLRAEPEVVVRLGERVEPGATRREVAECVAAVRPAVEVVDSRTGSWELGPSAAVADNALGAGLVTGAETSLAAAPDLAGVEVAVETGDRRLTGRGEAVMGGPLAAVTWLAGAVDEALPAGTLVSTGSVTETVPLRAGAPVTATFSGLCKVTVEPVEGRDDEGGRWA